MTYKDQFEEWARETFQGLIFSTDPKGTYYVDQRVDALWQGWKAGVAFVLEDPLKAKEEAR